MPASATRSEHGELLRRHPGAVADHPTDDCSSTEAGVDEDAQILVRIVLLVATEIVSTSSISRHGRMSSIDRNR